MHDHCSPGCSSLDVTDELTCIGDHQVQYCIPWRGAVYSLDQEVVLGALQESPGLPTARCAAFHADLGVIEDPQQDKSLRVRSLLELEEEGFVSRLPLTKRPGVVTSPRVPCCLCLILTYRLLTCV